MRCNFVDLYFALYGVSRPHRLMRDEAVPSYNTSLPRIPKLSEKIRSVSPVEKKVDIAVIDHSSFDNRQVFKTESQSNVETEQIDVRTEVVERKVWHNLFQKPSHELFHSIFPFRSRR